MVAFIGSPASNILTVDVHRRCAHLGRGHPKLLKAASDLVRSGRHTSTQRRNTDFVVNVAKKMLKINVHILPLFQEELVQ